MAAKEGDAVDEGSDPTQSEAVRSEGSEQAADSEGAEPEEEQPQEDKDGDQEQKATPAGEGVEVGAMQQALECHQLSLFCTLHTHLTQVHCSASHSLVLSPPPSLSSLPLVLTAQ